MRIGKANWVVGGIGCVFVAACGGGNSSSGFGEVDLGPDGGGAPSETDGGGFASDTDGAGRLFSDASTTAHTGPKTCQADSDCGSGGLCDPSTHVCSCGGTQIQASVVPPNLLLVMDRSCSMQDPIDGTPKWTIAANAISQLAQQYAGRIRFGLEFLPDPNAGDDTCSVSRIEVPVGPGNESTIASLLTKSISRSDPNYPSNPCTTPISSALSEAAADSDLSDTSRPEFTALITDGEETCADANDGTIQTITGMLQRGIKTFVVGFGSDADPGSLNSFAAVGGVPNQSGPNQFYDATDQAGLQAALSSIAQASLSCTLQLQQPLPGGDPSLLYVFFDKMAPAVTRDTTHQSGWDYDSTTDSITIYGSSCDDLKSGKITDVEAVYGCAGSDAPPAPVQ